MARPRLPGELTWPKLLGTSLAAVVAAWLGGRLGLGGTMMGVAIGSVIATFSTAFFTTTIDKTHRVIPTVLVRTDRGTVVETRADHDVTVVRRELSTSGVSCLQCRSLQLRRGAQRGQTSRADGARSTGRQWPWRLC